MESLTICGADINVDLGSTPPFRASRRRSAPSGGRIQHLETARAEAAVDVALVRRFNDGDETAFVEIVLRYRPKIEGYAERFLRSRADAQEIAQDTFVRAHRGLAKFRGEASLATWLYLIAGNLSRNRYGYHVSRRRHLTVSLNCPLHADTNGTVTDLLPAPEADPARRVAVEDFEALVDSCMGKLASHHVEILVQRNQLRRSYPQIAIALGIEEGTVKSRIMRARKRLRRLIAERCPEYSLRARLAVWLKPERLLALAH